MTTNASIAETLLRQCG